jgi:hypothetical protein
MADGASRASQRGPGSVRTIVATGTSGGAAERRLGSWRDEATCGRLRVAAAPQPPIGSRRKAGAASHGSQTGGRRAGCGAEDEAGRMVGRMHRESTRSPPRESWKYCPNSRRIKPDQTMPNLPSFPERETPQASSVSPPRVACATLPWFSTLGAQRNAAPRRVCHVTLVLHPRHAARRSLASRVPRYVGSPPSARSEAQPRVACATFPWFSTLGTQRGAASRRVPSGRHHSTTIRADRIDSPQRPYAIGRPEGGRPGGGPASPAGPGMARRALKQWPRRGSNPHTPHGIRDFKSRASASFATRPWLRSYRRRLSRRYIDPECGLHFWAAPAPPALENQLRERFCR